MINRYSLNDYTLTLTSSDSTPANISNALFGNGKTSYQIGGNTNGDGSFIGSIKIKRNEELWKTTGDHTGSWVHSLNLNKTGEVEIEIRQVADAITRFAAICKVYEEQQGKNCGVSISVAGADGGSTIAYCRDCYIVSVPEQEFSEEAKLQSWKFTCGRIDFYN